MSRVKKGIVILSSVLILTLITLFSLRAIIKAESFQLFGELVQSVPNASNKIALTLDDGPWSEAATKEVLDILQKHNIKATFFLNGEGINRHPNAAQLIADSDHQIGNHTYSHQRMAFVSAETVKQELTSTDKLIRSLGYQSEILFRPPYGSKLFSLPWYLSQNNIKTIMWDVEPEYFNDLDKTAEQMANYAIENTISGSIILMHVLGSNNQTSRDSLSPMIRGLQRNGYEFVTVDELLAERE